MEITSIVDKIAIWIVGYRKTRSFSETNTTKPFERKLK